MPRFGFREWIFSWNCFIAAMLALFVSFSLGLERPFWAMTTVYITSQPLSGAVRSKAVFRLIGTAVGGAATIAMVPLLANAPALLSLALALWVAGCQFVSLLDRTPRSYMFMLAGYTAALIGFPSVAHPELIFDTAVLRVQEIGIGVICAALVHSLIFPRSVSQAIGLRVTTLMGEAERWIADVLGTETPGRTDRDRRRLAMDVTELDGLAVHLPFDTARIRPARAVLSALEDRLVLLLPLVSAVEDRLRTMAPLPPAVAALAAEVRAWVVDHRDEPDPARAAALVARCMAVGEADPEHNWQGLLTLNLCTRLAELVEALEATRTLAARIIDPERRFAGAAMPPVERKTRRLHRDYALSLLSAAATMVALLGCCAFWIATGWPEGATATMISAVICCFFATMDDPVPAQRSFLVWTAVAVPITAVYLFAILPTVHTFETLTLVLAPSLLLLGLLMALPRWYGRMMPLMIGFGGGLALTNSFSAEFAGFINSNVALLIGTAAAIFSTRLLRVIGVGTAIRRIRRAGWRDLGALAAHAAPALRAAWSSRMLDRVGLLAARMGANGKAGDEGDDDAATSALRELRIGAGLIQLDEVGAAAEVRSAIGAHYRARISGGEEQPSPALLTQIDDAIDDGWALPGDTDRRRALSALTALRRNFFPRAAPWVPAGPERIAA